MAIEPSPISGVAVHHCADDFVALKDQTFVNAAGRVTEYDVFAVFAFGKVARAEQIATCDFQFGRYLFVNKGIFDAHQGVRQNLGLVIQRGHQTKDCAVVFNAFAQGQNVFVAGNHLVVNMHTFANGQTCVCRQFGVRTDADCHHKKVARDFGPIIQQQRARPSVLICQDLFRVRLAHDLDTLFGQRFAQQVTRGFVQLTFHQVAHDVDHSDVHTAGCHACCGL